MKTNMRKDYDVKTKDGSTRRVTKHKAPEPKRGVVSWGLSAAEIRARMDYCADPDVHGRQCVCLTVNRKPPKRRGKLRSVPALQPVDPPSLASGTKRMRVRDAIRWLQEMPQNHYLGAKVLLDADHPELGTDSYDEVVGVSQDDRGVWLLMANENLLAGGYHDALMKAVTATWGAICEGETRDKELSNFGAIEVVLDANHIEKFAGKNGKELSVMLDNLIKAYSHETVVAYIAAYVTLVADSPKLKE